MAEGDDGKEEAQHPPCLLELYLETKEQAENKCDPEESEKYLATIADNFNTDLVDLLNKYTQGHRDLSLVHTLRAAHLAMASQLGLVEEWLRFELAEADVPLEPHIIDEERGYQIRSGHVHAHMHLCGEHDHEDPHGGDEEPPMVH